MAASFTSPLLKMKSGALSENCPGHVRMAVTRVDECVKYGDCYKPPFYREPIVEVRLRLATEDPFTIYVQR
jgi:hypothetical protein